MAQILKPAQDIDVNDWLPSAGSLLYPMLDEDSPVDGDYVYTETPSLFEVAVEAATDPGSMVDHFVRYRARGDGNTDLRVSLVDYSQSPDEVVASWTESAVPVSFTDYEHELTSGQAGNITDYGSLLLRFEAADFTAPTLSSPQNGTETSDGTTGPGVSTNEANGTLYWAVLTNGGSCTDAQLKAGSGGNIVAGKAGNQAVSGTGAQITSDITGLSSSTDYELVWLHRDAAGNDSSQSTVGLTTSAGAGAPTFVAGSAVTGAVAGGTASPVIDRPNNLQDGDLIIIVGGANGVEDASGATLNGFTILTGNWVASAGDDGSGILMYKVASGEPATWTFTNLCPDFGMGAWGAVAYRGASGALDNSSTGAPASSATPAIAAMTPNVDDCVFIAAFACDPTAGLSATPDTDPAMNERFDAIDGILGYAYLEDYTQTTATSAAPSITATVADSFVVFYVSIKPA